jgi:HD-GYP domain-containing protein (c-di-GMP phosphodiesterase class II)
MDLEDFITVGVRALAIEENLGFDLYQLEEGSFRLYRHRSIPFQREDIEKLVQAGRETLYVPKNERSALYDHISSHLTQTLTDPQIPVEEKMSALTEASTRIMADVVSSPESAERIKAACKQSENHVVFALLGGEAQAAMQNTGAQAPYALAHAISVCNLSILLGIRCGIEDQQELRDLGSGGLLHEVGKSLLDDKYYLRQEGGPQISNNRLRNYPTIGKNLLEQSKVLPQRGLRLILEHQERLDGSGFPNALKGKEISVHGRIVAICDHFDELTTPQPSVKPVSPFAALKAMKNQGNRFDPAALNHFIRMLGGMNSQSAQAVSTEGDPGNPSKKRPENAV